jgi:hypothetical protein
MHESVRVYKPMFAFERVSMKHILANKVQPPQHTEPGRTLGSYLGVIVR